MLWDQDDTLAAGVLTGAGDRFSVGADIQGFLKQGVPVAGGRGFAGMAERPSFKPLIAAVEGLAVGGGFEMALACDLIVAAEGSKFGLPEAKVGLAAAGGGLLKLKRIPSQMAFELNLLGDLVAAERLLAIGPLESSGSPRPVACRGHRDGATHRGERSTGNRGHKEGSFAIAQLAI